MFVKRHLEIFKDSLKSFLNPDDYSRKKLNKFWKSVPGISERFPEGKINRSQILLMANDPNMSTVEICSAAMIWGGMNERHAEMAFKNNPSAWIEVADAIRNGRLGRSAAYDSLAELKETGAFRGMGPAFFTKLIYFLAPRSIPSEERGYIMDQWVGCSVNLLCGREVVKMNSSYIWIKGRSGQAIKQSTYTVADVNTSENYNEFCGALVWLAQECKCSVDVIDRALVSDGGKKRAPWRRYIVEHRSTHFAQ